MKYIIDGNNLAGKLEILYDDNWQQELIELLKDHFSSASKQVILVFDSVDPMGDKYQTGNITVIHAPKDGYYQSADDKIKELIETRTHESEKTTIVTDDIEIRKSIEESEAGEIYLQLSSELAQKLEWSKNKEEESGEIDNKTGLGDDEVDEVNKELLEQFKRKKKDK